MSKGKEKCSTKVNPETEAKRGIISQGWNGTINPKEGKLSIKVVTGEK